MTFRAGDVLRDNDFAASPRRFFPSFVPVQRWSTDIDSLQVAPEGVPASDTMKMGGKYTPLGGKKFDHKEFDC